jgi:cytochrome c-type biogenesis protein CcmF
LFVRFEGITQDQTKLKIGVKESDSMIDFVTIKAYIFPYINFVWVGLIIMGIGLLMSMVQRASISKAAGTAILVVAAAALFYMFLLAN